MSCLTIASHNSSICQLSNIKMQLTIYYITMALISVAKSTTFYPSPCSEDEFWCTNGFCISGNLVCDSQDNCGDNSDERSCLSCPTGSFSCGTEGCIEPNQVCSGVCDCSDCSEEQNGDCFNKTSPAPCHMGEFWCSNDECRSSEVVCDDKDDCGDSSDERSCSGCPSGTFSCPSDTGNSDCIDPALVCDTICDCEGCEDEDDECPYNEGSGIAVYIIIVVVVVIVICLVLYGVVYFARRHLKGKKKPADGANDGTQTTDRRSSAALSPTILSDLPPSYKFKGLPRNPIFIIDTVSLNGDEDGSLPNNDDLEYSDNALSPHFDAIGQPVSFTIGTPGSSRQSSFHSLRTIVARYRQDVDGPSHQRTLSPFAGQSDNVSLNSFTGSTGSGNTLNLPGDPYINPHDGLNESSDYDVASQGVDNPSYQTEVKHERRNKLNIQISIDDSSQPETPNYLQLPTTPTLRRVKSQDNFMTAVSKALEKPSTEQDTDGESSTNGTQISADDSSQPESPNYLRLPTTPTLRRVKSQDDFNFMTAVSKALENPSTEQEADGTKDVQMYVDSETSSVTDMTIHIATPTENDTDSQNGWDSDNVSSSNNVKDHTQSGVHIAIHIDAEA